MIEGERLYLRAIEPEDYILIHKWRIDSVVSKKLGGNNFSISLERDKLWTENKSVDDTKGIYWMIGKLNDNKIIGYCSMINIDLRNLKAELGGIVIGEKDEWGKGYGKEAVKIMLKYFFDNYPINKCFTYCLEENTPSIKIWQSLNFVQDGLLREDVYKDGEFKNLLLFSILRREINDKF